jgi:regulatory protein
MPYHKTYTLQEAQKALEHYCAYQERSHREVEEKLRKMGMIQEVKGQIILNLIDNDFLNEERFAKVFVSGKFRIKKWGRIKITQALRQKGVSKANIAIGLKEIDEELYLDNLKEILERKYSLLTALEEHSTTSEVAAIKQKVVRYLQQKGYEMELIYEYVLT